MSKFMYCPKTENEIARGPLIFSELETLANGFLNETLNLQQEFKLKSEFVNEQFMKILKNERDIENILIMFLKLQQQFSYVEDELKTMGDLLKQFKGIVQNLEVTCKMETFCLKNICGCGCCRFCRCKTERQRFLESLEDTNRKVEEIPQLLESMTELGMYRKLKNPYTEIVAILNCHCEILKNCEKNMNDIVDKLTLIELQQLQLKKWSKVKSQ